MADRHFVKYTFLKLDPAWRRLPESERVQHKQEFLAACEDFGTDHLLQSFSLVGTRGDADIMLVAETENLDRIHEFHVVLAQSGLAKWCTQPHSFLGLRKSSEYSDEQRFVARPFTGKYLFVYPFVKTRAWYALPAEERWRVMQDHIRIGKEYPNVDNHTTYSFGLDDQEFVVSFNADQPGDFLDLVQELRGTESSAYTESETPIFTCITASVERALGALDGEAVAVQPAS
jgi:chlorite dismutase